MYGFCNGNARQAAREYHRRFPHRHQPVHTVFSASFRRLREKGNPAPQHIRPHQINVLNEENVIDCVQNDPSISTRHIANQLQVSQNVVWRVLNREVLYPFHRQNVQALQPGDAQNRIIFCQWILQQHAENNNFVFNVLWSDEAYFTRDGINNFHNEHIWALQNPHAIRKRRFQQRFSVNLWGGIYNRSFLPLQMINDRLNANIYRNFLQNTIFDLIDNVPLNLIQNMYYQHDGAPPHRGRAVTEWLNEIFQIGGLVQEVQ
jgi:hypothetical protein